MATKPNPSKPNHLGHFLSGLIFLVLIIILSVYFNLRRLSSIPVFDFVILMLATFRLTHLLVYDLVMDFIRDYYSKFNSGLGKTISEIIHCPWCTATWMALFTLFIYFLTPYSWLFILVVALAGAAVIVEIAVRFVWTKYKKE